MEGFQLHHRRTTMKDVNYCIGCIGRDLAPITIQGHSQVKQRNEDSERTGI